MEQIHKQVDNNDSSVLDHIAMIQELNSRKGPFDMARNMSFMLGMSFKISGDMKELDDSIHYAREATIKCPEDYPHVAALFHDLGSKLFERYQGSNSLEDLDEALHAYFRGIEKLPSNHYSYCLYVGDFGIASILKIGYLEDMSEMFTFLSHVSMLFEAGAMESTSSPAPERFRAAKIWALLADACNHESALEAYEQAISFLPRLSSMATNVAARQETFKVSKIDGLSRNAALFAIKKGSYHKAIEFLEAGRAVFWLQALQLRSPMDTLRESAPNLHMRLSEISVELDKASMRMNAPCALGTNAERRAHDEELFRLEELNEEWQRTLDEVRELEEFEDFLTPLKISRLQELSDRLVIFLIPDEHQSHALVMSNDEVMHIDLCDAPYNKLQELVAYCLDPGRKELEPNEARPGILWKDVVQHVIHALKPYMNTGIYDIDMSSIESTFDYLVSSAGIYEFPSDSTDEFKMMVVIDPKNLPYTTHELTAIEKYVDPDCLFSDLKDGNLKISRIMEERMPNAALAFLCACETAMAMHLGATLLFSGFRGVVATMWMDLL
ncbi:hypothetical protein BDQ17DRAFT_1361830 [Cyathus striatus]|nr:hypothetical protein BDQ17DRAFT_1361830 [Cyathus striatus]